ncbi:CBS domain-containing protein [Halomonas pacifica]|uniref:CBS domain-containing protein n=1 Tax=Bisbaumannia pacifica TaxID=77098 RepID=A0A510XAW5_9GAMM|nr:CBS domain-containing protein [Halomonas pacifica]MBH8578889.1 CBS domain-containing protein [Halomonas pacifica]MDC8802358.1 CBS domain-containing protein [Halomonas pacifica]GEK48568.1 histidine kinase [Halomonas pacifica]
MQAVDIMTPSVVTVAPDTQVQEVARLLLENHISAVPVVDAEQRVLGIVSEGDLLRRIEGSGERPRHWLRALFETPASPLDYIKSHGRTAEQVMTSPVIEVAGDMPIDDIARLLEKHRIKRVPVTENGRLVGIVSRANLLRGFSVAGLEEGATVDDRAIRDRLHKELEETLGLGQINVIVVQGEVQLWGLVDSNEQRKAAQVAAEDIPGVKRVENNLGMLPRGINRV